MAITKAQARKVRQPVLTQEVLSTPDMGVGAVLDLELSSVCTEITASSPGALAASVSFSIDGVNFYGSMSVPAGGVNTYGNTGSSNLVKIVRVTHTGGTGKLVIAGY